MQLYSNFEVDLCACVVTYYCYFVIVPERREHGELQKVKKDYRLKNK